jgi:uncharacterized protein (UPF0332 family)
MDPRDFSALAQNLAMMLNAEPSRYRTAISRAYYAAFLVALDFIQKAGVEPRSGHEGHCWQVSRRTRTGR